MRQQVEGSGSPSPSHEGVMDNDAWHARRQDAVPRGVSNLLHSYIERARNAEFWDVEGNRYIDFASGIAVLNTGHLHPRVATAVAAQLEKVSHTCFQIIPHTGYVELAERLNALAPGDTAKKTLLLTTGAEAVENAVKIARSYTGRRGVVAFSGGFHGRTMMALALTGKVTPYKANFGPFPGDVYHLPFPIAYHGVTSEDSLKALATLLHADIGAENIAAILIEPVQGEGGFYPAPYEFLRALRALCDQHGIVLIIDEVQTGFCRTGPVFAHQLAGIEADLITMAKSLAGGFPLAAVTGKAEIMDAPDPGGLGGTFAGSPIACAAALAVLDVIEEERLEERASAMGDALSEQLEALRATPPLDSVIGDIRGIGGMIAMELVEGGDANRPAAALTRELVQACARRGLLILACGVRGNVIRFLAPLTISDELLSEGVKILGEELTRLAASAAH